MHWGYFFAWAAVIFVLFWVTGWPVTLSLTNVWGNHYEAKDLTFYGVLYFHYLLGALFFSFLGLGLFRNLIWKGNNGGKKQLIFLLAYSMLIASICAVLLTHRFAPDETSSSSEQEMGATRGLEVASVEDTATATQDAPPLGGDLPKVEMEETAL